MCGQHKEARLRIPVAVVPAGAGRLVEALEAVAERHGLNSNPLLRPDRLTIRDMHIEPSHASVEALLRRGLSGPVEMLNLLRFREVADYTAHPALAPEAPCSGRAAYRRYMQHTLPFLTAIGSEVLYMGDCGTMPVIGPPEERWDRVLLVRHVSLKVFLDFARDPAYLVGAGHRTAALADSRLVALTATP